jgi:heme exporter protein A
MSEPVIEARNLIKFFGDSVVMHGIDLSVEPGTGLMICGRNGAGKSTLIRILAGIAAPSSGEARLFGCPSGRLEPVLRRRVGLLSHESFLYPNLTARENLKFFCNLYRVAGSESVIDGWIRRVGLTAAIDERVRSFSRGMEQRLALARALLATPDVLLMDEPFAGLDMQGVGITQEVLREALARACAVVVTAHEAIRPGSLQLRICELVGGRLEDRCALS